ncbi:MAG: hypothetical protein HUU45_04035 [Leptospiraceae bacterium]|nr:hypothetical protein [Leptospiraceae bacterium]
MYVLVGGFIALLLSLVPQVLYEIGIMKYQKFYFSGGFFVFTLGLGWIAGNKYSKVYDELQDYSTNLEKKIQERALQIEEGNKIALESTMKIAKLEKENAIIQEREKIFTDMHDHIGAALSDLTFQIRNVKESSKLDHVQNENLQSALEKVVQKFRSHLHAIEDMKVLESDFINGLRLIVLRRYEFSKRKFHFFSDASTVEFFIKHSSPSQKEALLAIVSEICTNDLKYGKNNSEIRFLKNKKNIEIYFFSETNHDTEIHLTGMGEKTIQNRVLELNGTIKTKTENHHFFLEIRLPMYI